MSGEYLSDREQEEALRNWWRENWPWVLSGVVAGLVLLAAWNYWRQHVEQQSDTAAHAYQQLTVALAGNDKTKVESVTKELDDNFASSPYRDQAHLLLAQAHVIAGRFEMAVSELQSIVDKSKDAELAQVAKLRLARVHIQLGHYDQALSLLDVGKAGAFTAQVDEIRGDALLAKGDPSGARQAYQAAVSAAQTQEGAMTPSEIEYLQLKLQDLAASAPEATAKTNPPAEK
jgi:predicted negative regulator of RcsB-dependent stress response